MRRHYEVTSGTRLCVDALLRTFISLVGPHAGYQTLHLRTDFNLPLHRYLESWSGSSRRHRHYLRTYLFNYRRERRVEAAETRSAMFARSGATHQRTAALEEKT